MAADAKQRSLLSGRRSFRNMAIALLTLLAATLIAGCEDGGDSGERPVAGEPTPAMTESPPTREKPASTAAEGETPSVGASPALPSEEGEAPVFWRTEDGFESLRAGEPYKVLLRVTNGYQEVTLPITARCLSCEEEGLVVKFEASRVDPGGEEGPGAFYPFNLELPRPGMWQITVLAGDEEVSLQVEAGPASPSAS